MADWSLQTSEVLESLAATVIPRTAGAHTKGSWTQITAATTRDYRALSVDISDDVDGGGYDTYLIDLGIGAAAAEVVIVPNMIFDVPRAAKAGHTFGLELPIQIPAGTRIAARLQSSGGSGTRNAELLVRGRSGGWGGIPGGGVVVDIGTVTASTNGTLIDPSSSANTWGSWVELTASTANMLSGFAGLAMMNKRSDGALDTARITLQIGIGGSGSELVFVEYEVNGAYFGNSFRSLPWRPMQIPAGTRIAARLKCSQASKSSFFTLCLYGV